MTRIRRPPVATPPAPIRRIGIVVENLGIVGDRRFVVDIRRARSARPRIPGNVSRGGPHLLSRRFSPNSIARCVRDRVVRRAGGRRPRLGLWTLRGCLRLGGSGRVRWGRLICLRIDSVVRGLRTHIVGRFERRHLLVLGDDTRLTAARARLNLPDSDHHLAPLFLTLTFDGRVVEGVAEQRTLDTHCHYVAAFGP